MRHKPKTDNSLAKAFKVLMLFMPDNKEMGPSEIGRQLGYHKATVSRILLALSKYGFLQRNARTKKYAIGETAIRLGNAGSSFLRSNIVQIAKPHVDDLREALKETVVMEVLSGDRTYMAYVSEGPQRVRVAAAVGETLPRHAAAGAKAILAFSPPEIKESILNAPMPRLTPNTITDAKKFLRHLNEIRRQGVAFDLEEIDLGITAVGAPVFNHEGKAVAAIVVVGPSQRISRGKNSRLVWMLKAAAAKVSSQLYFVKGPDQIVDGKKAEMTA